MTTEKGGWLDSAHPDTKAIRAGIRRTAEGEHSEPIFTTSSFVFDSAEDAAAKFAGKENANVYSRYTNPTVRMLEDRLRRLSWDRRRWRPPLEWLQSCQLVWRFSSPAIVLCVPAMSLEAPWGYSNII